MAVVVVVLRLVLVFQLVPVLVDYVVVPLLAMTLLQLA